MLVSAIPSSDATLSTECHVVWSFSILKVPVLMCPVLSRGSHSGLCLINNEWNSLIHGQVSKSLVEIWSSHLISKTADWLNDHGSDSISLRSLGGNNVLDHINTSILLGSILVFELGEWVFQLRILTLGPWECWHVVGVSICRAAGKGSCGLSMVTIIEAHYAKAGWIRHSVISGVVLEGDTKAMLVGLSCTAASSEVNSSHLLWCDWHDHLSNKISIIGCWECISINFVSNKSIIELGGSSVNKVITVISENKSSLGSVHIEDGVSISVLEIVTL